MRPINARSRRPRSAGVDRRQQLAHFTGFEDGRFTLLDAMLRPPDGMGRIGRHDLALDQPIEKHTDGREVLFHGGFRVRAAELLDIGCDVHGRYARQVMQALFLAPRCEGRYSIKVSAARMRVAGVDGEELPEPPAAIGHSMEKRRQAVRGNGGQ
jgi:hypothetical protein